MNTVDSMSQQPEKPLRGRARRHTRAEAEALAEQVENDTQLLAGATVREIILAHPSIRKQVVAAAVRCLNAAKWRFDKDEGRVVHEPDYGTQIKAIAWLAAYSDGLPVQTNLNVNANTNSKPAAEIKWTSALIEAVERQIARAKVALQSGQPAPIATCPTVSV